MYYLHIYNSEKEEGSIVLPFEDMQPMINFVVDQYQKTIKHQLGIKISMMRH